MALTNNDDDDDDDYDDLYGDLDTTLEKPGSAATTRGTEPKRKPSGSRDHIGSGRNTNATTIGSIIHESRSPLSPNRVGQVVGVASASTLFVSASSSVAAVPVVQLKAENASMGERIRILEEENSRLRRNIGTLFRTAKNEIKRKDDRIDRLQQQQQQQQR